MNDVRRPTGDEARHRVIVVELDDVAPRRRLDRPNLYLGVTVEPRLQRYERLRAGAGPDWIRGHIIRLRPDLYRNYPPTPTDDAKRQKKRLSRRLKRRAYTVNRDTRVWSLYVVQLNKDAISDAGEGWVYVGETSRDPQTRLQQHLDGERNSNGRLYSSVVHRNGLSLREDLMEGPKTYYARKDAQLAEAALAEHLRDLGYRVEGGH